MSWRDTYINEVPGAHLRDEPLSRHTNFRIGGPADLFSIPSDETALSAALQWAARENVKVLVIGGGCNLLAPDAGFRGLVIKVPELGGAPALDGPRVMVPAGMLLNRLVNFCAAAGLSGLENLAGIPGTIGGAVHMNAGAYRACIADSLVSAGVISASDSPRTMTKEELEFGYRTSLLQRRPDLVVVRAVFQLQSGGDAQQLKDRISEILATRAGKHPLSQPSAGSFFKNTHGLPAAGVLIEQAGLKCMSVGGAMVSDMHANFLVNAGGATCADVLELMALVQDKVSQKHGVRLEPEVRIIEE